MKKYLISLFLAITLSINKIALGNDILMQNLKHPRYFEMFVNYDKYEKLNRKIFNFNLKMNKFFVRKIHILWDSIFPQFVINAFNNAYYNIEYPKRLVSCLFQQDMDGVKNETKRFFINSTIGAAGLIDAAFKIFKIEMYDEDMEQAFSKLKIKSGYYLVLPFLSSTTPRDIFGRIFDFLLTPSTYFTAPIAAAVKLALLINRTEYIQPIAEMVESNFVDPYDIARKFYAVKREIKFLNYDRKNVLAKITDNFDNRLELVDKKEHIENLQVKGVINSSDGEKISFKNKDLIPDINLSDYNPQSPILDSLRTSLFDVKSINNSFWSDYSIWNRSFKKRIKSAYVPVVNNRPKYKFRYILQKDKNAPLVIIFPSIGEGVNSHHSIVLAKIFYDKGYSAIIFGNCFQWEFLRSLEESYRVGNISRDVKYVNLLISNAIKYLSDKYDRSFLNRTAIGTSLGGFEVLFLANYQYVNSANNIDYFIAICPPFDLSYAVKQIDKIMDSWKDYPDDLKSKLALVTAKAMRALKEKGGEKFEKLPFSTYEAKLISGYIFHQKLSDIIFQIEKNSNKSMNENEIYEKIFKLNFSDYINNYLTRQNKVSDSVAYSKLDNISNYLINCDNYKIYHSIDDYLISPNRLFELKEYAGDKLVLFNHGSHLGFLYRDEFKNDLQNIILSKNVKY